MLQNEILECVRQGYQVVTFAGTGESIVVRVRDGAMKEATRHVPQQFVEAGQWVLCEAVRAARAELERAEPKEYTVTFQCEPSELEEIHKKACNALFSFNADGIMGFPPKSVMLYRHSWSRREDGCVDFKLLLVRDEFIDNGVRGATSFSFIPADAVIEPPLEMSTTVDKPLLLEGERVPDCADGWTATIGSVDESAATPAGRLINDFTIHSIGLVKSDENCAPQQPCPRCGGTREIAMFNGTSPCPDCVR